MKDIEVYEQLNNDLKMKIFDLIFKDNKIAWWIHEIETNIVRSSRSRADIHHLNYSEFPKNISGILEMIHPSDIDYYLKSLNNVLEGKIDIFEFEYKAITQKNSIIWLSDRWEAIKNSTGKVGMIIGITKDVTDIKEIEWHLVEKSKTLQELTNNLPVGVYRVNNSGRIIFANNNFAHLLGFPGPDFVMNKYYKQFFMFADEKEKCFRAWIDSNEKEIYINEYRLSKQNGETFWVRDIGNAIRDSDGNIIFFYGAILDINEQKIIADTVKYREAQLQAVYLNVPNIILQLDITGKIFYSNKFTTNHYIRKLIGTNFFELIDNNNRIIIRDKFYILTELGITQENELMTAAFTQDMRRYQGKFSAVKQDDIVVAIVVILTDITFMKDEYFNQKEEYNLDEN